MKNILSSFRFLSFGLVGVMAFASGGVMASPIGSPSPQYSHHNYQPTREDYRRHPGHGRLVCREERVRHVRSSDNHQIAGTAIGAIAGGLLGNQVGGGNGKTLATVAGAVGGGVVGHNVQKNHQRERAYYTTERRCWRQ